MYDVFLQIDKDNSGEIDLDEFLVFFVLQKSRFAIKTFSILDSDGSGEISFDEFVIGLYNFCTFDPVSLMRFAFTIYDADGSGYLDSDEIECICKDLYGKRNYKSNISAQRCIAQLKNGEWNSSNDQTTGGIENELDFVLFEKFCRHHEIMLLPAFLMQYDLQKQVLGAGFWDAIAVDRKNLETKLGCHDLVDRLKEMAATPDGEFMEMNKMTSTTGSNEQEQLSPKSTPPRLNKYIIASPKNKNKNRQRASNNNNNKATSPKNKEDVKARIKKELRASRKATQKGLDPEAAKKGAREKHAKDMKIVQRKKSTAKKEIGLLNCWVCNRCQHVNNESNKCITCGIGRSVGSTGMSQQVPLSPKRRRKKSKTFGG